MKDVALPTARDCMSSRVLTFSPDQELFAAIAQLLNHHFAAAPVVDEEGRLTGMLTEKDCLRVLSNLTYEQDFSGGTVRDYQSPIRITCDPDMDVFRVTERFLACNFPLLPVVEDDRLVGVISRRDTLRGVEKLRDVIARTKQQFESSAGAQMNRPRSIESLQRAAAGSSTEQLVGLMGRKT